MEIVPATSPCAFQNLLPPFACPLWLCGAAVFQGLLLQNKPLHEDIKPIKKQKCVCFRCFQNPFVLLFLKKENDNIMSSCTCTFLERGDVSILASVNDCTVILK